MRASGPDFQRKLGGPEKLSGFEDNSWLQLLHSDWTSARAKPKQPECGQICSDHREMGISDLANHWGRTWRWPLGAPAIQIAFFSEH